MPVRCRAAGALSRPGSRTSCATSMTVITETIRPELISGAVRITEIGSWIMNESTLTCLAISHCTGASRAVGMAWFASPRECVRESFVRASSNASLTIKEEAVSTGATCVKCRTGACGTFEEAGFTKLSCVVSEHVHRASRVASSSVQNKGWFALATRSICPSCAELAVGMAV